MKSILLSIKPKWVAKILNGKKTIEVRKRFPKDYKGWVYIYCTKEDSLIKLQERYKDRYVCEQEFRCDDFPKMYSGYEGKGKVVARFYCNKVEHFEREYLSRDIDDYYLDNGYVLDKKFYKQSCLTEKELFDYIGGGSGYAIHISQLEIFDKPKELGEFYTRHYPQFAGMVKNKTHYELRQLTKAPQSYMFIEVEE